MAGRLGVLRRLVGVEGSLLEMQLDGAKAESRRSSSSHSCVRRSADALGPGEVRGRRTLLSHPRDPGLAEDVLVALESVGARSVCWFDAALGSAATRSDTGTASSLMTGVLRKLPS
jgi:hypothetical protein